MARCSVILLGLATLASACLDEDDLFAFMVEGHAMSPTLEDGDRVVALDYDGATPGRGDIIVFAAPTSVDRLFIKRIIGLPGDSIEIDAPKNRVLVNGDVIEESYAKGQTRCLNTCSWAIPPTQFEISLSKESYQPRSGATQPVKDEPCAMKGCYFVMGDNRENSSDSRQGWLVPAENIRGFVVID